MAAIARRGIDSSLETELETMIAGGSYKGLRLRDYQVRCKFVVQRSTRNTVRRLCEAHGYPASALCNDAFMLGVYAAMYTLARKVGRKEYVTV